MFLFICNLCLFHGMNTELYNNFVVGEFQEHENKLKSERSRAYIAKSNFNYSYKLKALLFIPKFSEQNLLGGDATVKVFI